MGKSIKGMTLEQAQAYQKELKSAGRKDGKEYGKVTDYIKTIMPNAEERFGKQDLGNSYEKLSRGVTLTGGWTEQNLDSIENYTGNRPQLSAPGGEEDLGGYLDGFQNSVYNVAGSNQLRDNIQAQLEPTANQEPETLNRVDEFNQMREDMGVEGLETSVNDLKAQLEEQYAIKRQRTQTAEGGQVAMGVIGGRVSEIERQENERIDAIGRQLNVMNDQLQTSYSTISTMINLMGLDYQDAKAAYDSEYNKNLQLYKLVDEEMDEQVAAARANLNVYTNAIMSGNMSYSSLSSSEKAMISKLEVQSGLPIGFVSSLHMNPKDRILGTSSDGTQAWIIGEDGNLTTVSTGLKSSTTGIGSSSMNSAFASARAELNAGSQWGAVWDRMEQTYPDLSNEQLDTYLNKADYYNKDSNTWNDVGGSDSEPIVAMSEAISAYNRATTTDQEDAIIQEFLREFPEKADDLYKQIGR